MNKIYKDLSDSEKLELESQIKEMRKMIRGSKKRAPRKIKDPKAYKEKLQLAMGKSSERRLEEKINSNADENEINNYKELLLKRQMMNKFKEDGLTIYEFVGPNISVVKHKDHLAYITIMNTAGNEFALTETASDINKLIEMYKDPIIVDTNKVEDNMKPIIKILIEAYVDHIIERANTAKQNKEIMRKYSKSLKYRTEYDKEEEEIEGDQ